VELLKYLYNQDHPSCLDDVGLFVCTNPNNTFSNKEFLGSSFSHLEDHMFY